MTGHPELDRLAARRSQADALTDFLDWLTGEGLFLMRWGPVTDTIPCPGPRGLFGPPCDNGRVSVVDAATFDVCPECVGAGVKTVTREGWAPDPRPAAAIVLEHLGVDQATLAAEEAELHVRLADPLPPGQGTC